MQCLALVLHMLYIFWKSIPLDVIDWTDNDTCLKFPTLWIMHDYIYCSHKINITIILWYSILQIGLFIWLKKTMHPKKFNLILIHIHHWALKKKLVSLRGRGCTINPSGPWPMGHHTSVAYKQELRLYWQTAGKPHFPVSAEMTQRHVSE